jgi:hypothetical protein
MVTAAEREQGAARIEQSPIAIAGRMPIASDKLVMTSPAIGIRPKKLKPKTAEMRPRRCAGARSCTMVFARPKFVARPIASTPIEAAATMKLLVRDMTNNAQATNTTAPIMKRMRFPGATLSNPNDPTSEPLPDTAIRMPICSGPSPRMFRT